MKPRAWVLEAEWGKGSTEESAAGTGQMRVSTGDLDEQFWGHHGPDSSEFRGYGIRVGEKEAAKKWDESFCLSGVGGK